MRVGAGEAEVTFPKRIENQDLTGLLAVHATTPSLVFKSSPDESQVYITTLILMLADGGMHCGRATRAKADGQRVTKRL